jgi:HK97 gp10 family phage protein
MSGGAKITGLKEIDAVLKGLPLQVQDKILQAAGAAAAFPLVAAAHRLAPVGRTGRLADSIGVQKSGFNMAGSTRREVGAIGVGPRRGQFKGNHGHLPEYGTKKRHSKSKNGRSINRGVMPKKPFMEPAFEQTKDQVLGIYNQQVGRVLYNFMKRTIKNSK